MSGHHGVLFFGSHVPAPSLLWMRRMLEGLGDHVTALATEAAPTPELSRRYKTVLVEQGIGAVGWRLLRGVGWIRRPPATGRAVRTLVGAIADPAVDVTLLHYLTTAVQYARVWQQTSKPAFVHCHGYDVTWDLRLAGGRAAHDRDYPERVNALPAHVQFIANSSITRARLREVGVAHDRIHLKYLGVPVAAAPTRRSDSTDVSILYLGRLVDFKGPVEVIRAFSRACERGLAGRLVVAGDGPLMAACVAARGASAFRDRIALLGAVDAETGERLRREADIFTAHNQTGAESRQQEAFGVSVAEAMADGLPVVTGRSGSLPELIVDGEQGRLVEPGDIDAHADALLALASDPGLRAALGRHGWQRARDRFSLEHEQHRLREILGIA